MVKGLSKKVIVLHQSEPSPFEEAIFILREGSSHSGVSRRDLLKEAMEIAAGPSPQPPRSRRILRLARDLGLMLAGAGICAAVFLLI